MIEIIESLLSKNHITQTELYNIYSDSKDEYERRLLSMTNRISETFLLTYDEDYAVAKQGGQLVVCFYRYCTEDPERMWVTHSSDVNEYTLTLEDGNSITYVNPNYVEKSIKDYYRG